MLGLHSPPSILQALTYIMDFDLLPIVSRCFHVLCSSPWSSLFQALYPMDRSFQVQGIRWAFTVFQLMTILEEAHHSLIIIEHDPCSTRTPKGWSSTSPKACTMLLKRPQSCCTHLELIPSWRI